MRAKQNVSLLFLQRHKKLWHRTNCNGPTTTFISSSSLTEETFGARTASPGVGGFVARLKQFLDNLKSSTIFYIISNMPYASDS